MNVIKFGKGTVSVVAAHAGDDERKTLNQLIIEPDMGTGEIGSLPNRKLNEQFNPNEDAVVLEFSNAESVMAVIGQLKNIEKALSV